MQLTHDVGVLPTHAPRFGPIAPFRNTDVYNNADFLSPALVLDHVALQQRRERISRCVKISHQSFSRAWLTEVLMAWINFAHVGAKSGPSE